MTDEPARSHDAVPPIASLRVSTSVPRPIRARATRIATHWFLPLAAAALSAACAIEGARTPVVIDARGPTQPGDLREVRQDTIVRFATGAPGLIRKGTQWRRVGRIPQGEVHAPVGNAFALGDARQPEAYLVTVGGRLVGFYLPVEQAFSPLDLAAPTHLWEAN